MIAVDTSALMAVLLGEPDAERCVEAHASESALLLSAGPAADALIVAERRGPEGEMAELIDGLGFEIVPGTGIAARRNGAGYAVWGKGRHPAGLNFGDCFAYVLAQERRCPLLFVGDAFARTDVIRAE